ncbi:hypothetical protein DM01DRAFT_1400147 [Hesseltinella vesiculosa]|uniref:Uncharacterized protein n=1 Tax=Hesseltinella vesiculosa TaxID=101127 RepID=A0A1X2GPM7_9FUNG|nr:hypothetical protein DM01DRAFT_1400147 [Hesseltinella vesiculosa]
MFLLRVVRYCEEIISKYGVPPVVLVIVVHECKRQVMNKARKNKTKPFCFFQVAVLPMGKTMFHLKQRLHYFAYEARH